MDSAITRALALGNVYGDGDLDIVLGNSGPNRLYTNLHHQLGTPFFAVLSQSYDIEFHAKPGYGTAAHTGTVVLGLGLAHSPLSLPPLGSFYLAPPLLALPPIAIPQSTGMGTLSLPIPGIPSLVGVALYSQALVVNQANPADARFTGYVVDVIRR